MGHKIDGGGDCWHQVFGVVLGALGVIEKIKSPCGCRGLVGVGLQASCQLQAFPPNKVFAEVEVFADEEFTPAAVAPHQSCTRTSLLRTVSVSACITGVCQAFLDDGVP